MTGKKVSERAVTMYNKGLQYVYGAKNQRLTESLLRRLSESYPNYVKYSKEKKKIGKVCIDCSGLVAYCASLNYNNNSYNLSHNDSGKRWSISDLSHLRDGMYVWKSGHIGLVVVECAGKAYIIEAKGSAYGVTKTEFKKRYKHFMHYGELEDVDYTDATKYVSASKKVYYHKCLSTETSIVDALNHLLIDPSFEHRKRIALANGIANYKGTANQNTKLLKLLKKGKLVKVA